MMLFPDVTLLVIMGISHFDELRDQIVGCSLVHF